MGDWVVSTTFAVDPGEATMDEWETALEQRGFDSTIIRVPRVHQSIVRLYVPGGDMIQATVIGHDLAAEVVGLAPVGVETCTEAELERRREARSK